MTHLKIDRQNSNLKSLMRLKSLMWIVILAFSLMLSLIGRAEESAESIRIIEPEKKIKKVRPAIIDHESFELGAYTGILSVEDFNTNLVLGAKLNYHFLQKFFLETAFASSDTERANTEGNQDFNPDRTFEYLSFSLGYELISGRSFWGSKRKYNSGIYMLGGVSNIDFAGESKVGGVFGMNYKTVLTDWLTLDLNFKNYIVNRNFLGEKKSTQNTELSIGVNSLF